MPGRRRADGLGQTATPALVYDCLLGGKTHYDVDRRAAERLMRAKPDLQANAKANRRFLARAVRHLAGPDGGITQFLDIGTGIPTTPNVHEVAQDAAPESRVVYVDIDPVVLLHAQALMVSSPEGATAYVEADLRDPGKIIAAAAGTLDLRKPVAVLLLGIVHLLQDAEDPYGVVASLLGAVPGGSYLALSHPASDIHAEEAARGAHEFERLTGKVQTNRSKAEVARFFSELELVPPGVVQCNRWHPDPSDDVSQELSNWAAVGRKP